MIEEFHDASDIKQHDSFQAWREANPTGHFLALSSRRSATLHGSSCQHLGDVNWTVSGKSLTKSRKVTGSSEVELFEWAKDSDVLVKLCQHCVRDGLLHAVVPLDQFHASTVDAEDPEIFEAIQEYLERAINLSKNLDPKLRRSRLARANKQPKKVTVQATVFIRNPDVIVEVLARAAGRCELCGSQAPFLRHDGTPYLEVHHRERLADGGDDTIENAIAVCPNCHRRAHFGIDRAIPNKAIQATESSRSPKL